MPAADLRIPAVHAKEEGLDIRIPEAALPLSGAALRMVCGAGRVRSLINN